MHCSMVTYSILEQTKIHKTSSLPQMTDCRDHDNINSMYVTLSIKQDTKQFFVSECFVMIKLSLLSTWVLYTGIKFTA